MRKTLQFLSRIGKKHIVLHITKTEQYVCNARAQYSKVHSSATEAFVLIFHLLGWYVYYELGYSVRWEFVIKEIWVEHGKDDDRTGFEWDVLRIVFLLRALERLKRYDMLANNSYSKTHTSLFAVQCITNSIRYK